MTVTATAAPNTPLPAASSAPASTDLASALASLTTQLQQLTDQLASLVQQLQSGLAATGASQGAQAVTGGGAGGMSGCACSSMQGMQGAAELQAAGANGAPLALQATSAERPEQQKQKKRKKHAKNDDTRQMRAGDTASTAVPTAAAPASFDAIPKKNPYSYEQMVARVKREVANPSRSWDRLCLGFVARAYGWKASGTETAIKQWQIMPDSMKHRGDSNPPPGALVFWDTGAGRAGHVAVYLGDGKIASNDIRRSGKIDIVPLSEISKKWGAKYLGWTPPYFENGV
ncbi:MAG: C40 family peptidase [Thermoleophilia bacterium]|nr:C40 family peptidase [Thermoleophilia bacterium]